MSTDADNDVSNKDIAGIFTIILAMCLLAAFFVFVVLNLRHWKTQTYKIRVSIIANIGYHQMPIRA